MRYVNGDPRDEKRYPKTLKAADKSTTLYRYRVDAIVYAPDIDSARGHVRLGDIEAASVERA